MRLHPLFFAVLFRRLQWIVEKKMFLFFPFFLLPVARTVEKTFCDGNFFISFFLYVKGDKKLLQWKLSAFNFVALIFEQSFKVFVFLNSFVSQKLFLIWNKTFKNIKKSFLQSQNYFYFFKLLFKNLTKFLMFRQNVWTNMKVVVTWSVD